MSDDYCLVSTRPGAYGFSLYNTAKLRPDNLMRIPQLGGALINADRLENEKALFYIGRYAPEKLLPGLALRAILLPQVTGSSDTVVRPIDSHESLKAIALSTMRQLAGAGASTLQRIKALTDAIPSYRLELGTDLDQIAPIISRIIDSST